MNANRIVLTAIVSAIVIAGVVGTADAKHRNHRLTHAATTAVGLEKLEAAEGKEIPGNESNESKVGPDADGPGGPNDGPGNTGNSEGTGNN